MSSITFSKDITPKEIRSLSAILAGERALPRRKDKDAEVTRFVGLAGSNLSKFEKAAAAGDMGGLKTLAADNVSNGEAEATPAGTPTGPADAGTSTSTSNGKRGRKSQFVGKILRAKVTENPRREGSKGHRSLGIILKAGKKGIAHSKFIEEGGLNNDLGWDITKGRVELADK